MFVLEQRIHSLDANACAHRLAADLDAIHRWADSFESPSALQSQVTDMERHVAQL
ncbi:hypothetical protein PC116_g17288 [Phytophthora cactorum]|nr:hypothetical protein Pcac1_g26208 [Phytophthora cactorum]KAG2991173.1 hypothetical protein PC120_g22764 [Phytophthora cactorum]KAG3179297.1 hypothetical protein PC128_g16035 [Phytophthora cactorum]KAG4041640.1 hypothetical protein PC123_g22849 [Phytophthora cactorum]KAG4234559.1 hypothetical protein PC116_g17288 [Phytophthora cactorum]